MRLASVLTPLSDENLTLAAQCGVDEIVVRYPGPDLAEFDRLQARVRSFGMEICAVEGYLPIERIKLGTDDGTDLRAMKELVRHLGGIGVPLVCYNFMAGTDWIRTSIDAPERGGAKTTAFCLNDLEHARIPGRPPFSAELEPGSKRPELWTNLQHFLEEIIPVAEESGVVMAMHPDDPPLPQLLGNDRIMHDIAGFERLVELVPSPCNKITFCQGTFSEMGIDIPATIRRLGPHIAYVHFRDVVGTADDFRETWQDNGQTDMAAAMRAYRDVGFDGPIRPDHVPQMLGEDDGEPGYTMLGRLFAYGYIRGMMHATEGHLCS
jgi:mannonate dehydratase